MRGWLRRMGSAALFWVAGTGALDVFEERLEAELDGVDVPGFTRTRYTCALAANPPWRFPPSRDWERTRRSRSARHRPSSEPG